MEESAHKIRVLINCDQEYTPILGESTREKPKMIWEETNSFCSFSYSLLNQRTGFMMLEKKPRKRHYATSIPSVSSSHLVSATIPSISTMIPTVVTASPSSYVTLPAASAAVSSQSTEQPVSEDLATFPYVPTYG